jgi:hypothetical protein
LFPLTNRVVVNGVRGIREHIGRKEKGKEREKGGSVENGDDGDEQVVRVEADGDGKRERKGGEKVRLRSRAPSLDWDLMFRQRHHPTPNPGPNHPILRHLA